MRLGKWVLGVVMVLVNSMLGAEGLKVGVIGGGIGGLSAAYRLHTMGFDVEVFEAKERLGGRILSAFTDNVTSELGGHNIGDGGDAPFLRKIVNELGLDLVEKEYPMNQAFYFEGKQFSDHSIYRGEFSPVELKGRLDTLRLTCDNMDQVLLNLFPNNKKAYEMLSSKLAGYEGDIPSSLSTCYVDTLYTMILGGLSSFHALNEQGETRINFVTVKGGNGRLIQKLGESLEDQIHLKCPLRYVKRGENRRFALGFDGGECTEVDILVLAIPCTVFRDIFFDKEIISEERLNLIQRVQYGRNSKIIAPLVELPKSDIKLVTKGLITFFDPEYQSLTFYYTGDSGAFESRDMDQLFSQSQWMVAEEYGLFLSKSLQYANEKQFSSYEGPVGKSWVKDPFVRGSYPFIGAGQKEIWESLVQVEGKSVFSLFAPIDQSLFFVGDYAVGPEDSMGTMESACMSGERAARLINKFYVR